MSDIDSQHGVLIRFTADRLDRGPKITDDPGDLGLCRGVRRHGRRDEEFYRFLESRRDKFFRLEQSKKE